MNPVVAKVLLITFLAALMSWLLAELTVAFLSAWARWRIRKAQERRNP